ncbi:TPA: glycosyltransferase family 4 protein [Vibrio vulnificus]|uniref:glycosyltransferase family 4 protein n=1 Tax=Vibrio vulnificus TaxID=672 RepID=UPI0021DA9AED|nr:glycosyltransferase family 4 protein [Vibrio vulnificus]EHY1121342.1 glycosyltransferase family 4 protein [Vibrio vulnificus]MCU8524797.1 glycosyltransferase family 4 protein [Vibrio vulnificus]MCU8529647.1 glycosyltransferase family 4 protein [Vibrio vulnificus]
MKVMRKVLFLYSEIGPYNIPVFEELSKTFNCDIHVVRWDKNCLKPYSPKRIDHVTYYKRSKFDENKLKDLIEFINPEIIYVSGWMDNLYLKIVEPIKPKGIPIVIGFDDIWTGSLRQVLGQYYFRVRLNKYFSHAWVAGEAQYEFARRLGFSRENIVFDLLSADIKNFSSVKYNENANFFLYVGNFRKVKGTDLLAKSFKFYRDELNGKFKLLCIGNGELISALSDNSNIIVQGYTEQSELIKAIGQASAFILPSRHDQWGVVAHEFATAGLPLIMSTGVGARSKFLINGYNGFVFENGSSLDLAHKMKAFESISSEEKSNMSKRSRELGTRISPQSSAASFMSLLGYK